MHAVKKKPTHIFPLTKTLAFGCCLLGDHTVAVLHLTLISVTAGVVSTGQGHDT